MSRGTPRSRRLAALTAALLATGAVIAQSGSDSRGVRLRSLTVESRPAAPPVLLGARPEPPPEVLAQQLALPPDACSVLVDVVEGLPGERAGLRVHDVVLGIDGGPAGPADIRARLAAAEPGEVIALDVLRAGARVRVEVELAAFDPDALARGATPPAPPATGEPAPGTLVPARPPESVAELLRSAQARELEDLKQRMAKASKQMEVLATAIAEAAAAHPEAELDEVATLAADMSDLAFELSQAAGRLPVQSLVNIIGVGPAAPASAPPADTADPAASTDADLRAAIEALEARVEALERSQD